MDIVFLGETLHQSAFVMQKTLSQIFGQVAKCRQGLLERKKQPRVSQATSQGERAATSGKHQEQERTSKQRYPRKTQGPPCWYRSANRSDQKRRAIGSKQNGKRC